MIKLNPHETELQGSWRLIGSSIEFDDVSKRIENLITNYLIEVAIDESGWNKLYQDPEDSRYWELTYPESEMHGGGTPHLKVITLSEAKRRYKV